MVAKAYIQTARESLGLNKKQMAEMLGITPNWVTKLESPEDKHTPSDTVSRLLDMYMGSCTCPACGAEIDARPIDWPV